ncbi:amidase family protein [Hortaea werneckii]|nr:amidase family protein [Hortaea werneckii]
MENSTVSSNQPPAWQTRAQEYQKTANAKIPEAWRLGSQYLMEMGPTSNHSVLDIPAKCGILSKREVDITENYNMVELVQQLASRSMSSTEVTTAFCKRAAIAQQLTSCLTETFFEAALTRAKECDAYLASHKKPLGPLHGVPISLKDSFNVKDVRSTIGFVSFLDHDAATDDAALVKILLSLGAVPYVKTNIPQTLMTADSHNNIFGRCLNPHKLSLTAGGSSGGEGALLAMRGSPIGVGTDIAGSIRIPAYVNGVYGLKPTSRRIPYAGQESPARAGAETFGVLPAAGPLARSVQDIEHFMSSVLKFDTWSVDEGVISIPWRTQPNHSAEKRLRLGFILEDPNYPLHPVVMRTMKTAIAQLEESGHQLIPLAPDLPNNVLTDAMKVAFFHFAMDPEQTTFGHIKRSGEALIPSLSTATMPEMKDFKPQLDDIFRLQKERLRIQRTFRELYTSKALDAILMPTYQATAVPHDLYGLPCYTVLANLLDYPAISIPFLKVDKKLDTEYIRNVEYVPPYRPDDVEGAPCGFQLVGRPMHDEMLLSNAQIVDDCLQR